MLALGEIVYAFLLVTLLHSIVLCVQELTALLADNDALFTQVYRWQRCGRLLAARENLRASVATIHHYRPALSAAKRARLAAAVHNFHKNYPLASCAEDMHNIEVYRHDNDQLPAFWPNYAFRRPPTQP